ncbi:ABC transporter ATP-binding protein [Halalkalicoccus sp. NIPERK01]|uniref:ABC transporter ATP-binding protein n=1 Tax=Halalkalicoccus sp. NIPERK01 TaxID=3053469 RepID=UPI00256F0471|nr:ABC transporter ATP-binding protein [Halalkalicoccus sp. NIPERK01]MDL5361002.1 ABC transporter ATP-binding protein [Halalkalicoccus sp. NIPERK01]
MTTVLETERLRKQFGDLVAVDDVSLAIEEDDVTSIIGPNGAGKTTFYNLLTGVLAPTAGSIRLRTDGELRDITDAPPHEVARSGLSRSYQITNVFDGLTVRENVQVARIAHDGRTFDLRSRTAADEALNEDVDGLLELTNLAELAETRCDELSHGEKRNVEIALALAIEPTVFLLDEPTAGMNPTETREVVSLIRRLNDDIDATFVVTEHDMDVVTGVSDRIVVLAEGAVLADGEPREVLSDERVTEAYLGSETV